MVDAPKPPEQKAPADGPRLVRVPADTVIANPWNPRDSLGDITKLAESMRQRQQQAAAGVTVAAYLKLYPEDAERCAGRDLVVVNGCRRHSAALQEGLLLDVVIDDSVAADRMTFYRASIVENIDREDFDVIEEAKAVEQLVTECGNRADLAAQQLNRTPAWVSQRRALLKLTPELQEALRAGEIAIRVARNLARVPKQDQVEKWHEQLEREAAERELARQARVEAGEEGAQAQLTAVNRSAGGKGPADVVKMKKTLTRLAPETKTLAQALFEFLGEDGVQELVREWTIAGLGEDSNVTKIN